MRTIGIIIRTLNLQKTVYKVIIVLEPICLLLRFVSLRFSILFEDYQSQGELSAAVKTVL